MRYSPEQQQILDSLNQFRQNPQMAIPLLKDRIARYRTKKGKISFVSLDGAKKIPIKEESSPQQRIQQLINIIQGECNSMGMLRRTEKLSEVAEQIFEALENEDFKQIELNSSEKRRLKKIIKQDEDFQYPGDINCMISIGFDQKNEQLMSILVDDDIPNRDNRKILMDPQIITVGIISRNIANKPHLRCTIILATQQTIAKNASFVPTPINTHGDPSKIKVDLDEDQEQISESKSPLYRRSALVNEKDEIHERVELQQDDVEYLGESYKVSDRGFNFNEFEQTFVRQSIGSKDNNAGRLYAGSNNPMMEYSIEMEENIKLTDKSENIGDKSEGDQHGVKSGDDNNGDESEDDKNNDSRHGDGNYDQYNRKGDGNDRYTDDYY